MARYKKARFTREKPQRGQPPSETARRSSPSLEIPLLLQNPTLDGSVYAYIRIAHERTGREAGKRASWLAGWRADGCLEQEARGLTRKADYTHIPGRLP